MIEINEIYPLFITNNLTELKEFYSVHFGFTAVFFDAEFYLHLLHPSSGNQLAFMLPNHPSQPAFLHSATSNIGAIVTFDVSDAKIAWQTALDSGLDIVLEYIEEPWGQSHFIIRDPQGLLVDIVEHAQPDT